MAADIFHALEGGWNIQREIKPGGRFKGKGVFTFSAANELSYHEQGQMMLESGEVLDAGRQFTYRLENERIAVYYADGPDAGALFHTLTFESERRARGENLCKEDFYAAEYVFELPEKFTLTYTVNGPKKDYTSESVFTRGV